MGKKRDRTRHLCPWLSPGDEQKNQRKLLAFTGYQGAPPCRVLLGFEPAYAGGVLQMGSALAEAYRVPHPSEDSLSLMLAQNDMPHRVHSRDVSWYTTIARPQQ